MTQDNRNRLEVYRSQYDAILVGAACTIDRQAKDTIIDVIRQEFNPNYDYTPWCGHCMIEMVKYAFRQMDAATAAPKITTEIIKIKLNNPAE